MPALDLADAELIHHPFPHFAAAECLDAESAEAILLWLETGAPWRVLRDDFYEFEGVNLRDTRLPLDLAYLVGDLFLDAVRRDLEQIFGTRLGGRAGVAAQRLVPGRDIGVHSDFGTECQTHRLLLQLNRGWSFGQGGILMLFEQERPERVTEEQCLYIPEHRSVVGFAISERSYHAVSRVQSGDRYTLCVSFAADA